MQKKGTRLAVLTALLLLGAAGVQKPDAAAAAKIKVSKVTVKSNYGSSVHVGVGKKVKITPTVKVTPDKAANRKVTYKSSKKKVATVSAVGYVKGVKEGTCKITVTSEKNKKKKATIKVTVMKPIEKIKLKPADVEMYVGETKELRAAATPATGAFAKVKWTTSDSKTASLISNGTVQAVAPGTAVIKAAAVDGSGKKGSCTVRVLSADTVNLASMKVIGPDAVRLTLDKQAVLTADQIRIAGKKYSFGSYNRTYNVTQIRTYDNKNYDITVDDGVAFADESYVRAEIPALPGNGTKEIEAQAIFIRENEPAQLQWIGMAGQEWHKVVDLSDYCYGKISYTVEGNVVKGLHYHTAGNTLIFSGTPEDVCQNEVVTIHALDEIGKTITQKVCFYIGDQDFVAAYAREIVVLNGEAAVQIPFVEAVGGSGSYTYSLANMPAGLKVCADGSVSGSAAGIGTYSVQVTVTDAKESAMTAVASAKVRVSEKRRVKGTVVDAKGAGVSGAAVTCIREKDGVVFETTADGAGNYDFYTADGFYQCRAALAGMWDPVYNVEIGAGGRQINFVLNKYDEK